MSSNDTTSNASDVCGLPDHSSTDTIWKTFAYCFIAFGSLFGNSLVIFVIFKNRNMRSTINYFIVNMSASDILFAVFVFPRLVLELYSVPGRWLIGGMVGSILCKIDHFIQDVSTAVSILSLVAIAVDRFYGVVYPMKPGLMSGKRVRRVALAATWCLGAFLHLPYFYAYKLVDDKFCKYNWYPFADHVKASKFYFLFLSTIFFFFPAAILVIVYSIIINTLRRQKFPGNQSLKDKKRVARRNRSVLRMVVVVVVFFICCWLPVNVSIYITIFHWRPENRPCYIELLFFSVIFIAYSNGCISPFLYFIFNHNFRQGLKKAFLGHNNRNSVRSNHRSSRRKTDDASLTALKGRR
ncbi:probable G-protein coupled receptor 19 [Stylophora pistillata]|uniref:probable G-protein coupled receptor 19 n=1 Tax=Stylophora pistillata TaxID=50429 RepID=UPI000C04AAD5|nr:probable G-protein coupled receptor 19 [Stylophora pistillata]XP_022788224.1 probable G-protein coupled receptor 19 [Stylophora pistillata]